MKWTLHLHWKNPDHMDEYPECCNTWACYRTSSGEDSEHRRRSSGSDKVPARSNCFHVLFSGQRQRPVAVRKGGLEGAPQEAALLLPIASPCIEGTLQASANVWAPSGVALPTLLLSDSQMSAAVIANEKASSLLGERPHLVPEGGYLQALAVPVRQDSCAVQEPVVKGHVHDLHGLLFGHSDSALQIVGQPPLLTRPFRELTACQNLLHHAPHFKAVRQQPCEEMAPESDCDGWNDCCSFGAATGRSRDAEEMCLWDAPCCVDGSSS